MNLYHISGMVQFCNYVLHLFQLIDNICIQFSDRDIYNLYVLKRAQSTDTVAADNCFAFSVWLPANIYRFHEPCVIARLLSIVDYTQIICASQCALNCVTNIIAGDKLLQWLLSTISAIVVKAKRSVHKIAEHGSEQNSGITIRNIVNACLQWNCRQN